MKTCAKRLRIPAISLILAALVLLPSHVAVKAGNRYGAEYSPRQRQRLLVPARVGPAHRRARLDRLDAACSGW